MVLALITALGSLSGLVLAQAPTGTFPATPLASKRFAYPTGIPYQADTENLIRGRQTGYNQCNSTTEGQTSLCQTSFINSIEEFCLWGPPDPNSTVGDTEGEAVAWCTRPGRGTRLIPQGALKGVQFMRTPDYIQVVGFIDQTQINIQAGDFGGEMDPHGADLRGNPLGGLMYSNAYPSNGGNANSFQQVIEWHNFIGSDIFCLKACDPAGPNAARFCEHIFDRIGCAYNAPNSARNGTFESCEGENQDFPGVYTENGQVVTYRQPPESLGPITTIPYTARIPASSNCVAHQSAQLYSALPTPSNAPGVTSRPGVTPTGSRAATGTGAPTPTAAGNNAIGNMRFTFSDLVKLGGVVVSVMLAV